MEDLKKKDDGASSSGIHVIEVNLSTSDSWVLDTGSGSHICTNVQGLKRSRILARGKVDLRVGNGAKVAALAIGTYELAFSSGLILSLEICYYVPAMSRNIISISFWTRMVLSLLLKIINFPFLMIIFSMDMLLE